MINKTWIDFAIEIKNQRLQKINNGTWTKEEQNRLDEVKRSIERHHTFFNGRWIY